MQTASGSCLDQKQNVNALIWTDLEYFVQLVVQRLNIETADIHAPGHCDVMTLSMDSSKNTLTRCTVDR